MYVVESPVPRITPAVRSLRAWSLVSFLKYGFVDPSVWCLVMMVIDIRVTDSLLPGVISAVGGRVPVACYYSCSVVIEVLVPGIILAVRCYNAWCYSSSKVVKGQLPGVIPAAILQPVAVPSQLAAAGREPITHPSHNHLIGSSTTVLLCC